MSRVAKMCELCQKSPAVVPDRTRGGRPIKRICSRCHSMRLQGDMLNILCNEMKKYEDKDF